MILSIYNLIAFIIAYLSGCIIAYNYHTKNRPHSWQRDARNTIVDLLIISAIVITFLYPIDYEPVIPSQLRFKKEMVNLLVFNGMIICFSIVAGTATVTIIRRLFS